VSSIDAGLFMYQEIALESNTKVGTSAVPILAAGPAMPGPKFSELIPGFLKYGRFELSFSPGTVEKYEDCLRWIIRDIGDLPVSQLNLIHLTEVKQNILARGASEARVYSMVFALKSFLRYCKDFLELPVLDYKRIKSPKRRRRDVIFLTHEEIEQFVNSISIEKKHTGHLRKPGVRMNGLRFRTLVEVLLGSGMRISEALSLNRDSIDWENKQAKIIGKGSKERTVFFNQRALDWVKRYIEERKDSNPALFITQNRTRLTKSDISKYFGQQARKAGITKKITPHILRHTMATNLLFNGCPISHVKEILGHDRLETTCRYYLGLDKSKAKEAHGKFLSY